MRRLQRRYERERAARLAAEAIAEQFTRDALHDGLTGLANRTLFLDRLEQAVALSRRDNLAVTIAMIDLDNFKEINDTLGHDAGDKYLCEAAERLVRAVRPDDTVARLGGDEFAVLMRNVIQKDQAIVVGRLRDELNKDFWLGSHSTPIAASIGIATMEKGFDDVEQLLRNADTAMYDAKRNSDRCYALFDTGMHKAMVVRRDDKSRLREAIRDRTFEVEEVPVRSIEDGSKLGSLFSPLWDGTGATADGWPELFAKVSEIGLDRQFAAALTELACRKFASGKCVATELPVSALDDRKLREHIWSVCESQSLAANAFVIEVNCADPNIGSPTLPRTLRQYSEYGFGIGISNVGQGMLPLSLIQSANIHWLRQSTQSETATETVAGIEAFAKKLGVTVTR